MALATGVAWTRGGGPARFSEGEALVDLSLQPVREEAKIKAKTPSSAKMAPVKPRKFWVALELIKSVA